MIPNDDVEHLYSIARKAARIFLGGQPDQEYEDATQEGVTWLLESPGRAWVRAVDGTLEDPEEQLVEDIVEHLGRVHQRGV